MGSILRKEIFISLVPNLKNEQGHGYAYHCSILKQFQKSNGSILALTGKACTINPLPKRWVRFFHFKENTQFHPVQMIRRVFDFCSVFRRVKKRWRRLFFLESFNTSDFFAFVSAAFFFAKKKDTLIVLFRYGLPQLPINGTLHLLGCTLLKWRFGDRFIPVTDSELIAKSFFPKLKLCVFPIPHTAQPQTKIKNRHKLFWWPGEPREAKGKKEIEALLQQKSSYHESIELACSKAFEVKQEKSSVALHFLTDPLPRKAYEQMLGTSDLVLLPYDPKIYAFGTSGIFVETIFAGKIPVVKEGSWLAWELKKYALDELIIDWDQPNLLQKLIQLTDNQQTRAKLKKMQATYRLFHTPDNFQSSINGLLEPSKLNSSSQSL